ncbi:lysophospholipid acyltransferase family protein [Nocardiopsis baichengensis]|uniref:lysophospholipid acyltransferase family protein n=1 Tax=Nocardiopsis baichengensis TaxID=280240 RepID=UPI0003498D13|nr:lysophospholipid acyltransferase family protein [Nocardiopsis baichengensis]
MNGTPASPLSAGAVGRAVLWRLALSATGGFRTVGRPPKGPCVLVANHSSHADTAALIAALPARTNPAVAAAGDYWFAHGPRSWAAKALTGAFPVRRNGGGCADLLAARAVLDAGRPVIVYPEGTRSVDDDLGRFHSGAARLAAHAGVPLVPVAIDGTRALLPKGGGITRTRVTVRFGTPAEGTGAAREQISRMLAGIRGRTEEKCTGGDRTHA